MARLKEMYRGEITEAMIKKFGYKNVMEVPKLDKIVVNMGVGESSGLCCKRYGNYHRTEGSTDKSKEISR